MPNKWTTEDSVLALSQGWDLFDIGGVVEIERIDCPEDANGEPLEPVFDSDYAAMQFVLEQYIGGCETAAKALTLSVFR